MMSWSFVFFLCFLTDLTIVWHVNVRFLYKRVTSCQVTWDWLPIGTKSLMLIGLWIVTMWWWWVHYRIDWSIHCLFNSVFLYLAICRTRIIGTSSWHTTVTVARTTVWSNPCRFWKFVDLLISNAYFSVTLSLFLAITRRQTKTQNYIFLSFSSLRATHR